MANVFISHQGQDTSQAENLAAELRAAGHAVQLDEWDIKPGDSIVEWMTQGIEGAAYVVVCYSASGVTSPWMSRQWQSALARQLNGRRVKLLPVRLTGGDPPAILDDIKYADLVNDWNNGITQLLRALR